MTLSKLMYGRCWDVGGDLRGWVPTPSTTPQLGLPPRVAARMLVDALSTASVVPAPLHWRISDAAVSGLSAGRRHQLAQDPAVPPAMLPVVGPLIEVASNPDPAVCWHPAFWGASAERCHLLWFLLAATGSEAPWEAVIEAAPGPPDIEERWGWRDSAALPNAIWIGVAAALRRPTPMPRALTTLLTELRRFAPDNAVLNDFGEHIVDVTVGDGNHHVAVRALDRAPPRGPIPRERAMRVRIAQLATDADWNEMIDRAAISGELEASAAVSTSVRQEIQDAFRVRGPTLSEEQHRAPDLIIFPEVTLPHALNRDRTVQRLVAQSRCAALVGHGHRALAPMARRRAATTVIFYVNEAVLHVPSHPEDVSAPAVRSYTIRKPLPTHVEYALGRAIENRNNGSPRWQLVHANSLRRFIHPRWGDFAVPICSDLLRPSWWQALQGTVLHLFIPAHNQDVDLFDTLSWSRAYDVFANVVLTNHGAYGGSFAWSPKHNHHRELAKLRGKSKLAVFADVDLPVQALANEQRTARRNAIVRDTAALLEPRREGRESTSFKAPPAGYRERP